MDKVKYGIENVRFAKLTYNEDTEKYTHGEIHKWPGCTSMTLPAAGENTTIYADNIAYYIIDVNQGYDGTLEAYSLPEKFETDVLGVVKNKDGVMIEDASRSGSEFVVFGQFLGSESPKRFILYRCKATRPDFGGKTKTETATPETISTKIKVMPRENDHVVKATCRQIDNKEVFDNWFNEVYEPDLTEASASESQNGSDTSDTAETGT